MNQQNPQIPQMAHIRDPNFHPAKLASLLCTQPGRLEYQTGLTRGGEMQVCGMKGIAREFISILSDDLAGRIADFNPRLAMKFAGYPDPATGYPVDGVKRDRSPAGWSCRAVWVL